MADLAQLESALVKADAAGDTEGARVLAGEVRKARAAPVEKFVPSGEKDLPSLTSPEGIAGNPVTRFALGAASPILGGFQLASNLLSGGGGDAVNQRLAQLEQMKQAGRAQQGSEGFDWTEAAGQVFSPAFLKAAKALPEGMTYVQKVLAGLGLGAGAGATAPVTEQGDFAKQKAAQVAAGTALGGAIPALAPVVTAPAKAAYHGLIEPWANPAAIKGRTYLGAAGDKAQEIIALLRQNKEIVPGSAPTAGEAAAPAGQAEFAALQRAAQDVKPSAYVARGDQQNAARIAALRGVGKDEAALNEAERLRASNAATNYGAARQEAVKSDAALEALLKRPSMDKALARAEELAKERNQPFMLGKSTPETQTPSKILGPGGEPASVVTTPAKAGEYPVGSLHHVKMALDDMVKNPERFGIGASEVAAITTTKNAFTKWLEAKVPSYATARETYAANSLPINQMQIGQYLEKKLVPALSDEAKQKAASFASAVQDAPGTIKRSTGAPRFDKLEQALTPQQMKVVTSIQDDLARGVRFEDLAKKGAQAAPDISGGMGNQKLPNLLNRHVMLANAIISRLEGKVNKKLAAEMATEMLNPPQTGELLAAAKARAERNAIVAKAIQQYGAKALGGAAAVTAKQAQ